MKIENRSARYVRYRAKIGGFDVVPGRPLQISISSIELENGKPLLTDKSCSNPFAFASRVDKICGSAGVRLQGDGLNDLTIPWESLEGGQTQVLVSRRVNASPCEPYLIIVESLLSSKRSAK